MRTCVGCRNRGERHRLLRVVAAQLRQGQRTVVPDPAATQPGRGAWIHLSEQCVERAERRRAFLRALRIQGPVSTTPVREYVRALASVSTPTKTEWDTSDGHAMSSQR
ncbi:MAG: hypothetical protein CSA58_06000 [Micrococcales bacterium]|nr:MAG: hypothetical protein CSB46_02810 [Micrococcales bacterium]PIE27122.1 MAG: hypothetical protein CSA58_06000 [Micrococcales bacterium]